VLIPGKEQGYATCNRRFAQRFPKDTQDFCCFSSPHVDEPVGMLRGGASYAPCLAIRIVCGGVALSGDGLLAISASDDQTLKVWR
jgi:hypothetical protein